MDPRFLQEIVKKSKNPVIALHPWLKADTQLHEHACPCDRDSACCQRLEQVVRMSPLPFRCRHCREVVVFLQETKSQAACLDRITSQLREWRDGIKEKLKNYGDRLEQKERFQDRISPSDLSFQ